MPRKSRLNPNHKSKPTLQELYKKGILSRIKIGLRHIIKPNGDVEYIGHDLQHPYDCRQIPNFYPGARRTHSTVVTYKGERAELTATLGYPGYEKHVLDVAAHFARNQLATDLLAASHPCVTYGEYNIAYGDAVLVTDNRMHWVMTSSYNRTITIDELEDVHGMLGTPRQLIRRGDRGEIFFEVEPDQTDITVIKLKFG